MENTERIFIPNQLNYSYFLLDKKNPGYKTEQREVPIPRHG